MLAFLAEHGFSPAPQHRALPFVFVFGRSSLAVSFYGANVYPENVAPALEQPQFAEFVTGKFVLQVQRDADENAALSIAVELARGTVAAPELSAALAQAIRGQLERLNSEFNSYVPAEKRTPTLRLLPEGEASYFPSGVKHRYTRGE
jgi:phenylacetate-CoA ligase